MSTQIILSSFDKGARAQNHSLQRLDFIILKIVKLKRNLKNHELDINIAKNGQCRIFPRQTANFKARREYSRAAEYCRPW